MIQHTSLKLAEHSRIGYFLSFFAFGTPWDRCLDIILLWIQKLLFWSKVILSARVAFTNYSFSQLA